MKFRSKPHEIEAFKFTAEKQAFPPWFTKAQEKGMAFITLNAKDRYIQVDNKAGFQKAYAGDWVCINETGNLFTLSNEEIFKFFIDVTI